MNRKQIARVVVASSMFALPAFAEDIPAEEEVTTSAEIATVDGGGGPASDLPMPAPQSQSDVQQE